MNCDLPVKPQTLRSALILSLKLKLKMKNLFGIKLNC